MRYKDYLKTDHSCPFCNDQERMLKENEHAFLTYALAPYHKHHLLVIPKVHMESLFEITSEQRDDIDKLLNTGMSALRNVGYSNLTIIVREGNESTKSIQHLHYHIIPNTQIGDLDHNGNERTILSETEKELVIKDIKSALNKDKY